MTKPVLVSMLDEIHEEAQRCDARVTLMRIADGPPEVRGSWALTWGAMTIGRGADPIEAIEEAYGVVMTGAVTFGGASISLRSIARQ